MSVSVRATPNTQLLCLNLSIIHFNMSVRTIWNTNLTCLYQPQLSLIHFKQHACQDNIKHTFTLLVPNSICPYPPQTIHPSGRKKLTCPYQPQSIHHPPKTIHLWGQQQTQPPNTLLGEFSCFSFLLFVQLGEHSREQDSNYVNAAVFIATHSHSQGYLTSVCKCVMHESVCMCKGMYVNVCVCVCVCVCAGVFATCVSERHRERWADSPVRKLSGLRASVRSRACRVSWICFSTCALRYSSPLVKLSSATSRSLKPSSSAARFTSFNDPQFAIWTMKHAYINTNTTSHTYTCHTDETSKEELGLTLLMWPAKRNYGVRYKCNQRRGTRPYITDVTSIQQLWGMLQMQSAQRN